MISSKSTVLTQGLGVWGTPSLLVTLGFGTTGGAHVDASTTTTTQQIGVRHAKPPVIRLSDLSPQSRQSTADFLKAQLGLDEKYAEAQEAQPAKTARQSKADRERARLADLAMRNAEIEAQDEIRTVRNNNILLMIMMANQ